MSSEPLPTTQSRRNLVGSAILIFVALFGLAVFLQWKGGAYKSEFGGHPDEAAHYVTGLMIRDYIAAGFPGSPLKYAETYYNHYPKVALGNWPPFFYIIQSAWSLIFSPSREAMLVLMAALAAMVGTVLFLTLRREFSTPMAALGALLFVCIPLSQRHTAMIMTEIPIALLSFIALLFFARYLDSERARDSILFGLFASAAILTKGSGLYMGLVPLFALLLARKFRIIKRPAFWVSALIVLFLCGPWTYLFRNKARAGWMEGSPSLNFTKQALVFYPSRLALSIGIGLAIIAVIGIVVRFRKGTLSGRTAVFLAGLVSLLIFHSIIPAGLEDRHLVPALPLALYFVVAGASAVAALLAKKVQNIQASAVITMGIVILAFALETFAIPQKGYSGFRPAARMTLEKSPDPKTTFLVSSDAQGEGMFISEIAMAEKRPGHIVRRASKTLASSTWSGGGYEAKFANETQLLNFLKEQNLSYIVVDTSMPAYNSKEHHKLLQKTAEMFPANFIREAELPAERKDKWFTNSIAVYRFNSNADN